MSPTRRRAIGVTIAAAMRWSAVVAAEPVEPWPWSSPRGEGCIAFDGSPAAPLRLAAAPLATCSLSLEHPQRAAGHRVEVSATFRAAPGSTGSVALLVTQFHRDALAFHRFESVALAGDGAAKIVVRTYVLPDSDRIVVGLQSAGASSMIDATDLALAVSTDPFVEGAMSDVARGYLDRALQRIADHAFALDPARAPSLLRESRALATGATTVEETHDAIRHALARIDDGHSRLLPATEVTAWTSAVPRPPYDIERMMIDSRIGYVRIPAFASLHAEQRAAYASFLGWTVQQATQASSGRPADGLVIDLRPDEGGSFFAMLDGVCGLFDRRRALGGFEDRAKRRVQSWDCSTSALRPTRSAAALPVAVLIGPQTASAGEMLAIAFRGRARTVLIGAPTRGLTTGVELVPLDDGAQLALATSVSVDADGHRYRAGVVPDIVVPSDAADSDRSIDEAVAWLGLQATKGLRHDAAPRAIRRQRVPVAPRAAAGISKSG